MVGVSAYEEVWGRYNKNLNFGVAVDALIDVIY